MTNQVLNREYFKQYFINSEKTPKSRAIGVEQEVIGFSADTFQRITYNNGIRQTLEEFVRRFGWSPLYEGENLISLAKDGSSISLEPGGQIELSAKPMADIKLIETFFKEYQVQLAEISSDLGIVWYSLGYDPVTPIEQAPWMPKKRYEIMRSYLPPLGEGVLHMMQSSATAQSSYDYQSESDMIDKMRITNAFSAPVGLLFSSSPFYLGKLSGLKSLRNQAWRNTDPNRTGFLTFVFEPDFGYDRYIDYILQVPMLIVERDHLPIDMSGENFKSFYQKGRDLIKPEPDDWQTHLGTVFPVCRLRNAIETRTCDSGPIQMTLAQVALWKGLLYDDLALKKSLELIKELGTNTFVSLHQTGYKKDLNYKINNVQLFDIMSKILNIAAEGLENIDKNNNQSDRMYLEPVMENLFYKMVPADRLIKAYHENKNIFQILKQNNFHFA